MLHFAALCFARRRRDVAVRPALAGPLLLLATYVGCQGARHEDIAGAASITTGACLPQGPGARKAGEQSCAGCGCSPDAPPGDGSDARRGGGVALAAGAGTRDSETATIASRLQQGTPPAHYSNSTTHTHTLALAGTWRRRLLITGGSAVRPETSTWGVAAHPWPAHESCERGLEAVQRGTSRRSASTVGAPAGAPPAGRQATDETEERPRAVLLPPRRDREDDAGCAARWRRTPHGDAASRRGRPGEAEGTAGAPPGRRTKVVFLRVPLFRPQCLNKAATDLWSFRRGCRPFPKKNQNKKGNNQRPKNVDQGGPGRKREKPVVNTWGVTHSAWNHEIRAAHGNGPPPPPPKTKIAVWTTDRGWVTGKVTEHRPNPRDPQNQVHTVVKQDRDGREVVFRLTSEKWCRFTPTGDKPNCPQCGAKCRPGKGSGTARAGPDGGDKKVPEYKHFCEKCQADVLATNPCLLERRDPKDPRRTEDAARNVRMAPARAAAATANGKKRAAPPAGPTAKRANATSSASAGAGTYRAGVDTAPHLMDTTFG